MSESQTGRAVEAVVFDVGRVLYRWDLRILFEQLIEDEERLEFLLSEVVTEQWHFQHDAGRPLGDMVPERQAQFPDYADALDAYRTRFNETIPGPVPGSLEIVRELHERDVPLYAITNFGAEFWDGFRPTAPIFDLFRDIVVSGKERIAKPDERIFALAARRFGHDPDKMLFIDDNAANIAAARALGWQVHHFMDASGLRNDLEARGLLPPE
ncbi:MAG: HAD-IA family hydrolase [Erythrobacter sp.]|nr:HAD-IA family hydrolase [Erythrobacter sp.]